MFVLRLLFTAFLLNFMQAYAFAETLTLQDLPCQDAQLTQKNFRAEVLKDLPFPPGAFVELKNCEDADIPEKHVPTEEALKLEEAEKQKALKKLSMVLSYLYHQQNHLAESYQETSQAYQELLSKKLANLQGYDHAVSNYEEALKNYGAYEAYLSVLPQAASNYENKMGSSLNNFMSQKADGAISMMKSPSLSDLSLTSLDLKTQGKGTDNSQEVPGERGEKKDTSGKQGLCTAMGAVAGAGENLVLATLANPMGALLGASLGATLCSKPVYQKLSNLQQKLGEGLLKMGSVIKRGLSDIGSGLYHWGKDHLYQTPSHASDKIAEHYEMTKDWLYRKFGWH